MSSIDTRIIDAININIMLADKDLNIFHMNPSVLALMREVEADLRKDLPHFSADRLVWQNIDVFHKRPEHQRHILASLRGVYTTSICVGGRTLDLRVTPMDFGYIVEWRDARARLQNRDYETQLAAISRSQSVIEFGLDECISHANENFLNLVGYSLEELKGKHHRWLLDAEVAKAPAYQEFWRRLKAGQFDGGQYKLNARGGHAVWLEATFNPVTDEQGRVLKFVAFGLNITDQVELLANLKTLIDTNIGELDAILDGSNAEAAQAAAAAHQTSHAVAAVAAASEEFVASIQEVARSMYESKEATEEAVNQVDAAGNSTADLVKAAQSMDGVASMIRKIANQINLLALNAAIEAAHAGEAGRGFAVVAQEVKSLAGQAARATDEIVAEIRAVQSVSGEVKQALAGISKAVATVRENVAITSSALEEQSAVSQSMSENMSSSSEAVATVTSNVQAIASALGQAAEALNRTQTAAQVLVR